jgi:hypothetical protein
LSGNTQVWLNDWAGTTEGDPTPGYFVIARNDTDGDLNLAWSLGGTAGSDDYALQGSFTILDGQSSAQVNVHALDDVFAEGPETLLVQLYETPDYTLAGGPSSAELTIADNDQPTISVSAVPTTVTEWDSVSAAFVVTLSQPLAYPIFVSYTLGGTASGGTDYYVPSGSGYVAGGETQVTIPVDLSPCYFNDSLPEGDETLTLTLLPAENHEYQVDAAAATATITIRDDDLPTVSVAATPTTVSEGAGATATFLVTLSRPLGHSGLLARR